MYCPNCGTEYREGFSRCADCEVDLVDAPPRTAEHPDTGDIETVFATGDPVALLTAQTLLDEAGIPHLTRGEGVQDLFGMGRLGTGFSVLTGPVEIQVGAQRFAEAQELLRAADLEPEEDEEDDDEDGEVRETENEPEEEE
ncbi:MAG TPA: DUF2007 domain-containing protein [Thermoanaerobaculia bacterium]|nr:DUF2007 domain-containing protein [Thermoanaerobaculia bacterium]